jgi:FkbM family methyltransferase
MMRDFVRTARFIANHPLASRRKVAAWRRWIQWQVLCRISSRPRTMPWIGGSCLVLERGMTGGTGNLYCGLHEFQDMALLLHYLMGAKVDNAPTTFLDVGANIGSYSILASKVCDATCLALEPVPATYEHLTRNVKANGVESLVESHCLAAGRESGMIQFTADLGPMNRQTDEDGDGPVVDVAVKPLDAFPTARAATFWKIDVEGAEHDVLAGAREALAAGQVQVVLLESNDAEIEAVMYEAGLQATTYDAWTRSFTNYESNSKFGNHVWVREPKALEKTCRKAPVISVFGTDV